MKKIDAISFCVMCFIGGGVCFSSFANTQGSLTRQVLSVQENKKLSAEAIESLKRMVKFSREKCIAPYHDYVVIYVSGIYEGTNKMKKNSAHRRALKVKEFIKDEYESNYSLEVSVQPINSSEIRLGGVEDVLRETSDPVYVAISC